jgi:ectoine hydroxylase-related dioxygenase (phytanoyl-CoA dioxygenase family)
MYNQDLHISVLICIDEATLENGCLEIVRKHHTDGMLSQEYKEVNPDFVKHAKWEYVTTKPGDVVFFDSYVPHRSAPNLSNNKRRVLYSTYIEIDIMQISVYHSHLILNVWKERNMNIKFKRICIILLCCVHG